MDERCHLCGEADTDGCECSAPPADIAAVASFLALMQAGGGLLAKSPLYIAEKFARLEAGGLQSLDTEREVLFKDWCAKWRIPIPEEGTNDRK